MDLKKEQEGEKCHERQNFWCPAESGTKLYASNRDSSGSRFIAWTWKLIYK